MALATDSDSVAELDPDRDMAMDQAEGTVVDMVEGTAEDTAVWAVSDLMAAVAALEGES